MSISNNNDEQIERSSFPRKLMENVGLSFFLGFGGSSGVHYVRGAMNPPDEPWLGHLGGRRAALLKGPSSLRLGGSLALYEGIYTVSECSFSKLRHKEDSWNYFLAGTATGAVYDLRRLGIKKTTSNSLLRFTGMVWTALTTGLLFTAIEGAGSFIGEIFPSREGQDKDGEDDSSSTSSESSP